MISELRGILNPNIIYQVSTPGDFIIVSENSTNTKLEKLKIDYLPINSLAFSLDYDEDKKNRRLYNQLTHYVNKAVDVINKSCDLVIVSHTDDAYIVSLVEMKSDFFNDTEVFNQLRNSRFYLQYLISMIKEYFPDVQDKKVVFKKIVVSTKVRSNKRPVHASRRNAPLFKVVPVETDSFKKASIGYGRLL